MGEIDLRGEKGCRGDTLIARARRIGERGGQERAANAIADRIDLAFSGGPFDDVEGSERAVAHVVFEAFLGEPGVRIHPGNDEHRESLVHAPLDEGFFRHQVEDIELVDPGRNDQDRPLEHGLGRG